MFGSIINGKKNTINHIMDIVIPHAGKTWYKYDCI